jgi:hypothetical protein
VTLSGDPDNVRSWEVALTDASEAVLAGGANAVDLNGADDGGTDRGVTADDVCRQPLL